MSIETVPKMEGGKKAVWGKLRGYVCGNNKGFAPVMLILFSQGKFLKLEQNAAERSAGEETVGQSPLRSDDISPEGPSAGLA